MNALTLVPSTGLPPVRQALVVLNNRISDAEKRLRMLQNGKAALAAELGRAAGAKAELQDLVAYDAVRLVDRLRDGGQWMLSAFGNARARELSASLSESRIQAAVGETALVSIGEEIAVLEREVSDLKAQKPDMIRAVLVEAADGFRADMIIALDDLRQAMTTLAGLDKITARTDGSFSPNERVVVEIPALGTMPAQAVVGPEACIARARSIWSEFADELDSNPLADVENLTFPHVSGNEDDGRILYDRMSPTEKMAIAQLRSQGA